MKKIYLLTIVCLFFYATYAQNSGRGFNFQAVARDANGNILIEKNIELKFSLLRDGATVTADYAETHQLKTDAFGTFSAIIGSKTPDAGFSTFSLLNFNQYNYWLKIDIKDVNGWVQLSKQQLLCVPYAESATNSKNADYAKNGIPIGTIVPYAGNFTEALKNQGWLFCDGSPVSKNDYLDLWKAIGEIWGDGNDGKDGERFSLPDLQGQFLRGVDVAGTTDPDKSSRTLKSGTTSGTVGSYQPDAFQGHGHRFSTPMNQANQQTSGSSGTARIYADYSDTWDVLTIIAGSHGTPRYTTETRPKNVYVNYIIKAK